MGSDGDDVVRSVRPEIVLRTSSSSNVEATVSETAVISCHVTGTPTPTVQWLVNGQPLDRSDQRYHVTRDGRTLTLSDVRVSDTGRYTCVADNSVGSAERDFDLDVLGTSSHWRFTVSEPPPPTFRRLKRRVLTKKPGICRHRRVAAKTGRMTTYKPVQF